MPRTNTCLPYEQLQLAHTIRTQYGNMVTAADVGRLLGIKNVRSYTAWLSDVPAYCINRRKKWFAADVAAKLYRQREEGIYG